MDAPAYEVLSEHFNQHSGPRFEKFSCGAGHTSRYGTYAGSRDTFIESRILSESDGTWEFVTPPAPSFEATAAAQKLEMSYSSASHSSDDSDATLTSPPEFCTPGSPRTVSFKETSELQYTAVVASKELKAVYRQSRQIGLLAAFQEAMDTAQKLNSESKGDESVVCPRIGCGDTLANAHALMYHLHIHDIDAQLIVCTRCKGRFEHPHEVELHNCHKKRISIIRPLRGGLRRILAKITFNS
ncbi:hypothetical protein BDZ97DRAFT_1018297 [Flammula alnicola]|nr:hypothetical protein BDZ97DRAFT_1018297 [Flammula alnicola]